MQNQIIAWVSSILLTIGTVWAVVERLSPKIRKVIKIAKETIDVIDITLDSASDRKLTREEIENIRVQINELLDAIK